MHWDRYVGTAPEQLLAAIRALPGSVLIDDVAMLAAANYLKHLVAGGEPDQFHQDPGITVRPSDRPSSSLMNHLVGLTSTSASHRAKGNYAAAVDAALEARRLLTAAHERDIGSQWRNLPHFFVQWGRALEVSGKEGLPIAFEYEEAHRLALLSDQPQAARRAAGHLAWHHTIRGRTPLGQEWLDKATRTGEPNPRYDAVNHLAAALIDLEYLREEESACQLARMKDFPTGEYWAAALWVESLHARTGQTRALLETDVLREVERRPEKVVRGGVNRRFLRALWIRLGHPVERREPVIPLDFMHDGVLAYRRADFHQTVTLTREILAPTIHPRIRAGGHLLTAAAALALNRVQTGRDNFVIAHTLIESQSLRTLYDLVSPEHLDSLATATIGTSIPRRNTLQPPPDTSALLATLTRREREILTMLASHRTIADIADELFVSINTVRATKSRLFQKLKVSSRAAAEDIAHRAGIGT